FLKVEHPAAVLLGQQTPLQLVGQARDHAAQSRQLGVQQGAQPVQFHRIAQFGRVDDLVECGGEGVIDLDRAAVVLGLLMVGALALAQFRGVFLSFAVRFARRAVGAGLTIIVGGLIVGRAVQRLAAVAAVLFFLFVRFSLVLIRLFGVVLAVFLRIAAIGVAGVQVQRAQKVFQPRAEGRLIVARRRQGVQFGARLGLQLGADPVQHGPG